MKNELVDPQLGTIKLRRNHLSKSIKISIKPDASIHVSMPPRTPLFVVKRFIESSKKELLSIRESKATIAEKIYQDQDIIGRSHKIILDTSKPKLQTRIHGQSIKWFVPESIESSSHEAQTVLAAPIKKVLTAQAKAYLPRRLKYLADLHDLSFSAVQFGNPKGRWGSCSSQKIIRLNIALMNVPLELIDYVLIHELCHTVQMNHSSDFWELVASISPSYREHRRLLKKHSPYL